MQRLLKKAVVKVGFVIRVSDLALNVETFFASSLVSVPGEIRPHNACTKWRLPLWSKMIGATSVGGMLNSLCAPECHRFRSSPQSPASGAWSIGIVRTCKIT